MWRKAILGALAVALLAPVVVESARANQVGITSAVLPNARGTPPEQPTRILEVGTDMFANERVQTVENGKVHLLFLDGSAMSIGPNSDIVLDEFVYNPDTKTGKIAFAATKGVFRFVGGRISKNTPVIIKTPQATIGIRGGVGIFNIGAIIRASLIFGDELFILKDGVRHTVNTAGFQLEISPSGQVSNPMPVTSDGLGEPLGQLEGTPEQTGETRELIPRDDVVGTQQLSQLGSNQSPQQTGPLDPNQPPPAEQQLFGPGGPGPVDKFAVQAQEQKKGQDNPDAGVGGGFPTTPTGLVGAYRDSLNMPFGTELDEIFDELINGGALGAGQFQGFTTTSLSPIVWPVSTVKAMDGSPGSGSFLVFTTAPGSDSPFGPIFPGTSFVSDDNDFTFVFGSLANFGPLDFIFAFAGTPTPAASIPTTGFSVYGVKRDLLLDGDIPFIPENDGGNFGVTGLDVGRAFINWKPNANGERAFAELTTLYSGLGTAQKSMTSVAVGRIIDDGTGKLHLQGEFIGSLRPSTLATTRTIFYDGDVSTVDAFGGADFFGAGAPDFFVLGNQSVNAADVANLAESGIDRTIGATEATLYNANHPATRLAGSGPSADPTRSAGITEFVLETAGISMEFYAGGGMAFQRIVPLETATNFLKLDGSTGTIDALANILGLDPTVAASLDTGSAFRVGAFFSDRSAFVSNDEFGAVDTSAAINGSTMVDQTLYFRSVDLRFENLLANVGLTPCDCDFLVSGLWGGQIVSAAGDAYEFHQMPWVAGPPVTAADFPMSALTATYTGIAVAQVYNTISGPPGNLYTAFGTFTATVSFSPGMLSIDSGTIDVDGFSMDIDAGSPVAIAAPFAFAFTGSGDGLDLDGFARFAGGPGSLVKNIYGHYHATDDEGYWQAGVFGAERP